MRAAWTYACRAQFNRTWTPTVPSCLTFSSRRTAIHVSLMGTGPCTARCVKTRSSHALVRKHAHAWDVSLPYSNVTSDVITGCLKMYCRVLFFWLAKFREGGHINKKCRPFFGVGRLFFFASLAMFLAPANKKNKHCHSKTRAKKKFCFLNCLTRLDLVLDLHLWIELDKLVELEPKDLIFHL